MLQPVAAAGADCVAQAKALVAAFTGPMTMARTTATGIAAAERVISTNGAGVALYQATARTGWHSSITAIQPALDSLATWVAEAHRFYSQTIDDLGALGTWSELNSTRAASSIQAADNLGEAGSAKEIALFASGVKVWLDDVAADTVLTGQTWEDRVAEWSSGQSEPPAHLSLHASLAACLTEVGTTIFAAQVACGATLTYAEHQ